jgi:hypothetical protein
LVSEKWIPLLFNKFSGWSWWIQKTV